MLMKVVSANEPVSENLESLESGQSPKRNISTLFLGTEKLIKANRTDPII